MGFWHNHFGRPGDKAENAFDGKPSVHFICVLQVYYTVFNVEGERRTQ
jgi:hypothetical protein